MNRSAETGLRLLSSAILLIYPWAQALAHGPQLMNYQGRLTDANGNPITTPSNQPQQITFAIFDAPSGGNQLWTETQSVSIAEGIFSVQLGASNPLPASVFAGATTYLQIQVGSETMTPLRRLVSAPYAANADLVQGKDLGMIYTSPQSGLVGIGSSAPTQTLDVAGNVKAVQFLGDGSQLVNLSAANLTGKLPPSVFNGNSLLLASSQTVTGSPTFASGVSFTGSPLSLTTSGRVGIGTTSPAAALDVNGGVRIEGAGNGLTLPDGTVLTSTSSFSGSGTAILAASQTFSGADVFASTVEFLGGLLRAGTTDYGTSDTNFGYASVTGAQGQPSYGDTVAGGIGNTAAPYYSFVGGGNSNNAVGPFSTVAGGNSNRAGTTYTTVGGGSSNSANAIWATIAGGQGNNAGNWYSTIAGGNANSAGGKYATVAGGNSNSASGSGDGRAFVGGGDSNSASGDYSAISGGLSNSVSAIQGFIGGGANNSVTVASSTIAGGTGNTINAEHAFIGGGGANVVNSNGEMAALAGGWGNAVNGAYGTLSGGYQNTTNGSFSTVPGGRGNSANGPYSFAAGYNANAGTGDFVWADSEGTPLSSTVSDEFLVRAQGGVVLNSSSFTFAGATGAPAYMTILNTGGVGIGTTNPAHTLDVNGSVAASTGTFGDLCLNGVCQTSWPGGTSTTSSFTTGTAPVGNGVVSRWSADNTFADSVGGNNGSAAGTVNFSPGVFGSAFSFNGTGYVTVPSNASLTTSGLTVSAWINVTSNSSWSALVTKSDINNGYHGFYFNLYNNVLGFNITGTNGSGNLYGTRIVVDGNWHHVAATYNQNSGVASLYVDGTLDASSHFGIAPLATSVPFQIGAEDGVDILTGSIDEVQFYNRALSPYEIADLAGNSSLVGGTLASWQASGTSIYSSNGGNVGIGTSAPAYALDVAGDINLTGTLRQNGTAVSLGGGGQWTTNGSNISNSNSGAVGIGTASPPATDANGLALKLDVAGALGLANNTSIAFAISGLPNNRWPVMEVDSGNHLNIGDINNVFGNGTLNDGITFYSGGQGRAILDKNGDLFIGSGWTGAAGGKLEVNGNVKVDGSGDGLIFPDGSKQVTAFTGSGGGLSYDAGAYAYNSSNPQYTAATDLFVILTCQSGTQNATPSIEDYSIPLYYFLEYEGALQNMTILAPIPKGHVWGANYDSRVGCTIHAMKLGS